MYIYNHPGITFHIFHADLIGTVATPCVESYWQYIYMELIAICTSELRQCIYSLKFVDTVLHISGLHHKMSSSGIQADGLGHIL